MSAPDLFFVRLVFDADRDQDAVERLWEAFSTAEPHLARPTGIEAIDGHIAVDFDGVSDDPTFGPTSVEHGAPGAEAIAALRGFSRQRTLVVPAMRALLTLSAMRERAGLPPRREVRVDVLPATPLAPQELSTHRSGEVAVPRPRFTLDRST
jgi:hypothetical protein